MLKPGRIIIFPQHRIGDLVTQTPVFREIKRAFPGVHLAVCVLEPFLKDLLRCDPNIDELIVWDRRAARGRKFRQIFDFLRTRYDWGINLSFEDWVDRLMLAALIPRRASLVLAGPSPAKRHVDRWPGASVFSCGEKNVFSTDIYLGVLRGLGVPAMDTQRRLYPCPEEVRSVEAYLKGIPALAGRRLVGLGVSCGNKIKEWPADRFAALGDALISRYGVQVVLAGDRGDEVIAQKILGAMKEKAHSACGVFSLGGFLALCTKLSLFISVDSGPLYVADAAGVPVVDITGPVAVREQLVLTPRNRAVEPRGVACAPCSYIFDTQRACRFGHRDCVLKIGFEDVLAAVETLGVFS
jgi:heptosyltransferase II